MLAAAFLACAPARAGNPQAAGLQVALRAKGLYRGPIDAVVGPQTVQAIKAFQRRAGLLVDGLAGPQTRAALGPLGRPLFGRRLLRRGMSGWDVSVLQFLLTRRGFSPGAIEGHFGPATQCALRSYQRSAHLVPDGVMGAVTLAALGRGLHVPLAPSPAVARPRYVVRTGDTLTTIASRYRTTPGAIARANGLDVRGVLPVGTKLRVPALAASAPAAESLTPEGVQAAIDYWAGYYGVSVSLARALAWMESGYQTSVRSPVGAWGVMQVLPETWAFAESVLIGVKVPRTAEGNIRVGIAYLHHLLNEFGGDTRLALGGWYQGPRAVREHGLFPETRAFVADVLALEERM